MAGRAGRAEAPLATTLKAKGLFNDHPYNMDIFGTLSTPATYEAIATSDCIVCWAPRAMVRLRLGNSSATA